MEKEEIVKKFLGANLQIDSKTLEYFSGHPNKIEPFLSLINEKKQPSPIITVDLVENIFSSAGEQVKVLKEFSILAKEISIDGQISMINQKYDNISGLLLKKLDLVNPISINKIDGKLRKFSIIGMIREKDDGEKTALVEDKTGKKTVVFQNAEEFSFLDDDDVVGLVVENDNEKLSCSKIVWPDIPLRREFTRTSKKINCIFLSSANNLEKINNWIKERSKENTVIFLQAKTNKLEEIANGNQNATIVTYRENIPASLAGNSRIIGTSSNAIIGIGPVNIMILQKKILEEYMDGHKDNDVKNIVIKFLKKRFLVGKIDYIERKSASDLFLNHIPDIISIAGSEKLEEENYKNTTIITLPESADQEKFYFIGLDGRESIKVDLT